MSMLIWHLPALVKFLIHLSSYKLLCSTPGDHDYAGSNVFRSANGKIVEHWRVLQVLPGGFLNDNGMF